MDKNLLLCSHFFSRFFYSSFFLPLTQFIFQASGTTKLLLKSPDKNNVHILHLLNIYAFRHLFAEALSYLLNAAPSSIPSEFSTYELANCFLTVALKAQQQRAALFPCSWHRTILPAGRILLWVNIFAGMKRRIINQMKLGGNSRKSLAQSPA